MDNKIIHLQEVSIGYAPYPPILTNINFSIYKGDFVFLIGKTGSGKSSLLKTLYADLPIQVGQAIIAEYNLEKIKKSVIPLLRRRLGVVFQDFQLLTDRNLFNNLNFFLKAIGYKDKFLIQYRIADILMKVGLHANSDRMPHQLSGGEQQRAVIARALLNDPLILLADEPTGNLDFDISKKILKLFKKINQKGTAILIATHDYQLIKLVQNQGPIRILECRDGKVNELNEIPLY